MRRNGNRLYKRLRVVFSLLTVGLSLLFLAELYYLNILNSQLFVWIVAGVLLVNAVVITGLSFFTRRPGVQLICSLLVIVLTCFYGFGSFYIARTTDALARLTGSAGEKIKNVLDVYTLKDSEIRDVKQLEGKTLGILNSINRTGTDQLLSKLEAMKIDVNIEGYANFGPLVSALYQNDVDAIVVNEMYLSNITGMDAFASFLRETQVAYEYTYYTDISYKTAKVADITQQPFTVMVNGSDSRGSLGDTDRSDVNMLVTINPKTEIVLMVSIPRDAYVETVCDPEYDCLQGQYDKLTHTGLHTFHTTQRTIEKLLGVDINYVFRANFEAVMDVVDALGGIDVNVAPGYAVPYFYTNDMFGTSYGVHEGINHLNGQAALMYARERYAYQEGDFQRIRNQQEVLQKIAEKATSPEVIVRYNSLLNTIDGNFWTDLSQNEIMDLIRYQIADHPKWTFMTYSLNGESDNLYCAESYENASVIVLDRNSVLTARDLIDAVLAGKTAAEINEMMEDAAALVPDYSLDDRTTAHQNASLYQEDLDYDPYQEEYYDPYGYTYSDEAYSQPIYPGYGDPGYGYDYEGYGW